MRVLLTVTTYRSDTVSSVSPCSLSGTKAWSLKHKATSVFEQFLLKKIPDYTKLTLYCLQLNGEFNVIRVSFDILYSLADLFNQTLDLLGSIQPR